MEKKGKSGKHILGIDQGGTKTAAAVMREDGFIVGSAIKKGAYFPDEGVENALEQMAAAAEEAIRNAVICAGTGMNGALIDKSGRQFVYGDYMGEKAQGGSALAKRALRKVFDAELGLCPPTKLKPLFLGQAEVTDVDALLKRYMTESEFRRELRFLMPQILMVAKLEDEAACSLLDEFSDEIVAYIEAGLRKMEMKPEEEEIVLAGSVFKGADNPLTRRVIRKIQERLQGAKVVQACYEPVVGACIMGLVKLGMDPSEREKSIHESASVLGLLRS